MKIGLIACCSKKKDTQKKIKAEELYISTLFKYALNYCKKNYDKVYILSAKHGLLKLDDRIKKYDFTLNKLKKHDLEFWYMYIFKQSKKIISKDDEIFYHCGERYRKGLLKSLGNKYHIPLDKLSIGKQLQYYKNKNI